MDPPAPPPPGPMNTFDRYFLREWLLILALVVAALCGLLVAQICFDELRTLLQEGARLREVTTYVAVSLPGFLSVLLPAALLISLLYVVTTFRRAHEVTAMRAVGVGLPRLAAPVLAIAILCCALQWALSAVVVPWSVRRTRKIENELHYREQARTMPPDWVGATPDVGFDEPQSGRLWFINRYNRLRRCGYGVSVWIFNAARRPIAEILAARAGPGPDGRGWLFADGRLVRFDPASGAPASNQPFALRPEPAFTADPELMLLTEHRPGDLSIFELRKVMRYYHDQNRPRSVPYAVRYDEVVAGTFWPLLAIAIALPFSVTGVRVNPVVGVSKSLGLFFLYYLLAAAASWTAARGWSSPRLAAWIPDIGLAAVALPCLLRLR
jgi:lipopolysaccharide export system permease protein